MLESLLHAGPPPPQPEAIIEEPAEQPDSPTNQVAAVPPGFDDVGGIDVDALDVDSMLNFN